MRFFILTISMLMLFGNQANAQDSGIIGLKLFEEICFKNYATPEKRKDILDAKFVTYEGENRESFLKVFDVEEGQAWGAVFPTVTYSIVIDFQNNNCYMASPQVPKVDMHSLIIGMSENAKKQYEDYAEQVVYIKPTIKMETKASGFNVVKKRRLLMSILAVTQDKPRNNQPAIMLVLESH